MLQQVMDEIEAVDARAFEMARAVLDDPAQQQVLANERQQLSDRLDRTLEQLKREHPKDHAALRHRVSEITVDLDYVKRRRFMSLRLGRVHQQRQQGR